MVSFLSTLEGLVDRLNDKHKTVVIMRYGLEGDDPATLEQVGNKLKITRERVRQLQMDAVKRLKELLACDKIHKDQVFGTGSVFH